MSESKGTKSIIEYNNYKQIADKIIQLLDKIRNSALSDKRWVWELMQNAKDVPNKFKRVSIKIDLWEKELVFSHNGDCFTAKNLTGLIQQVSSKDSANDGEQKQTGKFGSGFITTHLLSDIIEVSGIVQNPNTGHYQKFDLELDRSACKSEDMIESIKKNLDWVRELDEKESTLFPPANDYESRKEDDFDTTFTYPLTKDGAFKSAKTGLDDLVNTLPITMVSLPEIKSVKVEDHINNVKRHYVCNSETLLKDDEKEIIKSCIDIEGKEEGRKYYLTYKTFKDGEPYVALSIEIGIGNDGCYELVARNKDLPVLFRDFPLIGSENFYFPYMLNGFNFDPTETRSGILLNRNELKPRKNRAIIESAIKAVLAFNEWLLSQGVRNTYLMASSREPIPAEPWDDSFAGPWIKDQMKLWHDDLLKQKLLETPNGYVELEKIKIPNYGGKEANRKFYEFLSDFNISGHLPLPTQLEAWTETISWAKEVKVSKEDFLKDLNNVKSVPALSQRLGKPEEETYAWLNKLYKFIKEQGDVELLDEYAIVPNQKGEFLPIKDLKTDSTQRIPEQIKSITNDILKRDLHDTLLAEEIDDTLFILDKYSLDSLIQDVNREISSIKPKEVIVFSDRWLPIYKCVCDIIALHSNNEEESEKRKEMYELVSHFDSISDWQQIDNLPASLWSEADKFIITYIPYLMEYYAKTLSELGNKFLDHPTKHNDEECINWLNDFRKIAKKYGYQIPEINIYPNQLGELKALKDMHYDKGIPAELLDLNITASDNDWRQKLLDKRICDCETQSPLGVEDIYREIRQKFDSRDINESKKMEIAQSAIRLYPTSPTNEQPDSIVAYNFLRKLNHELPEPLAIENSSGFSWEIFAAYILNNVCKQIADIKNITALQEETGEDEGTTVNYVDSVIDFAMNQYGKRYQKYANDYGVWINQKGDFCKLSDISRDNNIDETIKELATNKIVGVDFREKLLRKGMTCERFLLQDKVINTEDILEEINRKISGYVEEKHSLQERDFADLVLKLNSAIKKHHDYAKFVIYFETNKDRLIVGSIGDEKTLSFIGSLVSSEGRLDSMQRINEKYSDEELKKIADGQYSTSARGGGESPQGGMPVVIISGLSSLSEEGKEAAKEKARKQLKANGYDITDDLPVMELGEDGSLSEEERQRYNEEARLVALERLKEDGFDISSERHNYSLVHGVTKNGVEFPLVIKSYTSSAYEFKLNPNEWEQLMQENSMMLVHTGGGNIECVSFSNLFKNQDRMSLHFSLEALGNPANISNFAAILKFFKGCHFNFSNLITTRYESLRNYQIDQNNPNAFIDYSPDNIEQLN